MGAVRGAATTEVARMEGSMVSVSSQSVVLTIPLGLALKIIGSLVVVTAVALALLWRLCCGRPAKAQEPGTVEAEPQGKRNPRRPRRVMCEAGVQGPVHYTGVNQAVGGRYQHIVQGFSRGDEVTRVVADRPHAE